MKEPSCFNLVEGVTKVSENPTHSYERLHLFRLRCRLTQLLTDPSLVSHLGELLQVYREAPPEKRDQALLEAMRASKGIRQSRPPRRRPRRLRRFAPSAPVLQTAPARPVATSPAASPPFEPDIFTPTSREDRRRHTRMKCFVAVETASR